MSIKEMRIGFLTKMTNGEVEVWDHVELNIVLVIVKKRMERL